MAVTTCYACDINSYQCYIFEKSCPYDIAGKCEYYYSKGKKFPEGFKSYLEIVNMLAQARANKTQQIFNKYILIISSLAIIISIISILISLII
jgi:hypothetical protein